VAKVISAKSRPDQDRGGDKTPLKPLTEIAASTIPFHPFAAKFPLMKGRDFDELVKDIGTNGLRHPIIQHEGQILDGRNRYRACLNSGVAPIFHTFSGDDPFAFVISANIHRRHLTPKQKRDVIAELLKQNPERSNLATAKAAKADDKTVDSVRKELVSRSEIPNVETRTDTKGRKQPGSKTTRKSIPKLKTEPVADDRPEPVDSVEVSTRAPAPVEVESPPSIGPEHDGEVVCETQPAAPIAMVDPATTLAGVLKSVIALGDASTIWALIEDAPNRAELETLVRRVWLIATNLHSRISGSQP
jgi:hypothetical protein